MIEHTEPSSSVDAWLEEYGRLRQEAPYSQQSIVITANQRLARELQKQLLKRENGQHLVDTLNIQSFNQFVNQQWLIAQNSGLPNSGRYLLPKADEHLVWQQIVDRYQSHGASPNAQLAAHFMSGKRQLAKGLAEASSVVVEWQLSQEEIAFSNRVETQFFCEISAQFYQTIQEKKWLTFEQVADVLTDYFKTDLLPPKEHLGFYGFNDISPLQNALFNAVSSNRTRLFPANRNPSKKVSLHKFEEFKHELTQVAHWTKRALEKRPDTRIAVIVPGLHREKGLVERIFNQVFAPQTLLMSDPPSRHTPFELSIGSPLAKEPVIDSAISLARLTHSKLERNEALTLLSHVFWGNGLDKNRSAAIVRAQKWDAPLFTRAQLCGYLRPRDASSAHDADDVKGSHTQIDVVMPLCLKCINNAITRYKREPRFQSMRAWAEFFKLFLTDLNWPGVRTVNSREYQAIQMFVDVIGDVAQTDRYLIDSQHVSFETFLAELRQRSDSKIFQLQLPTQPIQIMGVLEANGLEFDYSYLVNVTKNAFPESSNPNVYLPFALQKKYRTPRSSAEKELYYAKQVLSMFASCGSQVHFCYSQKNEGEDQTLSPLVETVCNLKGHTNHSASTIPKGNFNVAFDNLIALFALRVEATENGCAINALPSCGAIGEQQRSSKKVKRGISIIEDTILDPLNAYFKHRLGAHQPTTVYAAISPLETGNIVHAVLAEFWQKNPSQARLKILFDFAENSSGKEHHHSKITGILMPIIDKYIIEIMANKRFFISDHFIARTTQRLCQIILTSLEEELNRPPFSIQAVECEREISLGGVNFAIKIDRIDRLSNERFIVIDYKTGNVKLQDSLGIAFSSAQLPVYAQDQTQPISAVCFSLLGGQKSGILGIGELTESIVGIETDLSKATKNQHSNWSELTHFWHDSIEKNIETFCAGSITHPKDTITMSASEQSQKRSYSRYLDPLLRNFEQPYLRSLISFTKTIEPFDSKERDA